MARIAKDVTDAELGVLEALWDLGQVTVRQLAEKLYGGGGASACATVQKLLERLEGKGLARRERGSSPQLFSAMAAREQLIGQQLRAVAAKLCGGSMTPLLTHLVKTQSLSTKEREQLRSLIDQLDDQSRKQRH